MYNNIFIFNVFQCIPVSVGTLHILVPYGGGGVGGGGGGGSRGGGVGCGGV